MRAISTVMNKESIEEVKYLEIRDNPEYHDLRLLEKRNVEDVAIARRQAEISYKAGMKDGITLFAWWKDGVQYVGTCGNTLKQALKEVDEGA